MSKLSPELLKKFVAGQLTDAEMEEVLIHLSEDEESLNNIEDLWQSEPMAQAVSIASEIDPKSATRIKRKVIKRIHRSDLSGQVVQLGVRGFMDVTMAMLRPLLGGRREKLYREEAKYD